jgi:microcin C transport system substrate-binding protein
VQAADVVASFNTLTRDRSAAPLYRLYWADVKQVVALDAARCVLISSAEIPNCT